MTPDEFLDDQGSVRYAFNAAVAASHMAEHFYKYHDRCNPEAIATYPSWHGFLDHVNERTNGSYRHVRSIANAYKHLYVSGKDYSSIDSAGDVEVISLNDGDISEIEGGVDKRVHFTPRGVQQPIEFLPQLRAVVEFWEAMFAA